MRPEKARIIEELAQKLSALKQQKSEEDYIAHGWADRRDRFNEQVRSLRAEILGLRNERDRINERVKELKQQRDETTKKIHEKAEETKKLNRESEALARKKPPRSRQALQKEVEDIDWRIQTTSLTLQEDKELVEEVKHLETQLNVHRKLQHLVRRITEIRDEIKALKKENELCHQELIKTAKRSQEIHQSMLEKIEESKKLKAEADNMHKQFLEIRQKTKPLQDEVTQITAQIRQMEEEGRELEEREKKQSEDALRAKLEKQAKEKLKRGEKLSWEEFQLLAEKGITAED